MRRENCTSSDSIGISTNLIANVKATQAASARRTHDWGSWDLSQQPKWLSQAVKRPPKHYSRKEDRTTSLRRSIRIGLKTTTVGRWDLTTVAKQAHKGRGAKYENLAPHMAPTLTRELHEMSTITIQAKRTTDPARSAPAGTGSPGASVFGRVVASVGSLPATVVPGWLPGSSSSEIQPVPGLGTSTHKSQESDK